MKVQPASAPQPVDLNESFAVLHAAVQLSPAVVVSQQLPVEP